jgi:hypothetical protein
MYNSNKQNVSGSENGSRHVDLTAQERITTVASLTRYLNEINSWDIPNTRGAKRIMNSIEATIEKLK